MVNRSGPNVLGLLAATALLSVPITGFAAEPGEDEGPIVVSAENPDTQPAKDAEDSEPRPISVSFVPTRAGYYMGLGFGETKIIPRRDLSRYRCRAGTLIASRMGSRRYRVECL